MNAGYGDVYDFFLKAQAAKPLLKGIFDGV
jgi:hypothetical protein